MARIVAELGRPETPEETAARKAESSRVYRSSQSFRNLIAALLATLAVVAVVIFAVPRGELPTRPPIDVAGTAAELESSLGRTVLVPDLPGGWSVNGASIEGTGVEAWTIIYVPHDDPGFLRFAQGFDASESWAAEMLAGSRTTGTVTLGGVVWDEYAIADPSDTGNVSYALGTAAGRDRLLLYGSASAQSAALIAEALAPDVRRLQEEAA